MKPRWLACTVVVLVTGLASGCAPDPDSAPSAPELATLQAALSERDELERTYLLTKYLRAMGPEDVPGALGEIEKHRVGITADEVRLFMLSWARFDAPEAFATAKDWPTPWKSVLMEQAMHAWAFNDGQAALAECDLIEDEALRQSLRSAVVSGWVASRDRRGATEFAAAIEGPRQRNRLAFRLTGDTMRDGPEAVLAWADSVPIDAPNDFKNTVFVHAAGAVTRLDPELVVPWYERHMKNSYARLALRNIATKWAQHHEPAAVIAWIEALALEEEREYERPDAVRAAFRVWAADAPQESEAWLESVPPSPVRDAAIEELARATVEAAPAKALEWIKEIADEERRRQSTLRYTRQWHAQDPGAAQSWIVEADIPNEWRQQVLNNLGRGTSRAGGKTAPVDG